MTIFLGMPSAYCENTDATELFRQHCAALAQKAERMNAMAVAGKEGFLFLAGELRHIGVGKFWGKDAATVSRALKPEAADPLPAILDFNEQLKKSGVKLLVVPVPPKAVIYPEMLPSFTNINSTTRLDTVHQEFYALLRSNDVAVLDLTDYFLQNKGDPSAPLYCRQDSHWSGKGCVLAAGQIAREASPFVSGNKKEGQKFQSAWREIEIVGDLWPMLNDKNILKESREKLRVRKISMPDSDEPVKPDRNSSIILLGDSHNLIFHAGDDMLFQGAGLPDQLALEFSAAVDLIAVRGSGATPARINLLRRAQQNKDYWKNKKCVIWCFSAREFTESDGWRKVPIK